MEIPNFLINDIKSKISGSVAQFDSTVFPSAPQAAINACARVKKNGRKNRNSK